METTKTGRHLTEIMVEEGASDGRTVRLVCPTCGRVSRIRVDRQLARFCSGDRPAAADEAARGRSSAAAALGAVRSERKAAAARANGARGGRPRDGLRSAYLRFVASVLDKPRPEGQELEHVREWRDEAAFAGDARTYRRARRFVLRWNP